jgi:purine-nucleoside phosphorylase
MTDDRLARATDLLRERIPWTPEVVLVLGSGLGSLADALRDPEVIPFDAVPGFPPAGVAGHAGRYAAGHLEGRRVLVQAGRFHLYEGHGPELVAAPVRIAARLGAPVLLVTNAAGGVDRRLDPGRIMLVDDHIDLTWRSPLAGAVREGEARFPDMSAPYDPALQRHALDIALELGIPLARGTYAAALGPSYETPAEVRMLARMGASAVGMSTVPEVITARAAGMRVVAFSLISNHAAGISPHPLSHEEVLATGRAAAPVFEALVRGVVRGLP